MSDAYQCDRCGSLSPGVAPFVIDAIKTDGDYFVNQRSAHPHADLTELCKGCRHSFEEFLKGAAIDDQEGEDGD